MNRMSAIPHLAFTSLQEAITPALTSYQKKIALIAMAVFSALAAAYIVYQYCLKPKTEELNHQSPVKSFSSYTKGLYQVSKVDSYREPFTGKQIVRIRFPISEEFKHKIEKRHKKFPHSLVISLNGVPAHIGFIQINMQSEIIAMIDKKLFLSSSLKDIQPGSQVSVGMASINPEKWLLKNQPKGRVKLIDAQIAKGHEHTEEFTFECSRNQYKKIKNLKYIGLNGSGFFIQDRKEQEGRYTFTIHAGKETREKSIFNRTVISPGTECTLTLPFVVSSN